MAGNPSTVSKSYREENPVKAYCLGHSTPLHPVQQKLQEDTLALGRPGRMLGAPEVISLNALLIKSLGAKKVLDIGVFTGASALAAALALPADGRVLALDVNEEWTAKAATYWAEAGVADKIQLVLAPATETLAKTLAEEGEAGSYDFAFIDADKTNYDAYYEACLKLLRPGGLIAFDNTLWSGAVMDATDTSPDTLALKALNEKIGKDSRVTAVLMNIGDGLTLVSVH